MVGMDAALRRLLMTLSVCAVLLAGGELWIAHQEANAGDTTRFGTPLRDIPPAVRSRGLRFGASVSPKDQAWILAAIEHSRPEAQQLIAKVDGLVEIDAASELGDFGENGRAIGVTHPGPNGFRIELDTVALDGDASFSRDVVVLHELGHVIDFSLIDKQLADQLDATIPTSGQCMSESQMTGACTAPEERFADTFAKWALRGAVSAAGAGYQIGAPLLEEWGAPLAVLAAQSAA
jgi:hypothetical protein